MIYIFWLDVDFFIDSLPLIGQSFGEMQTCENYFSAPLFLCPDV